MYTGSLDPATNRESWSETFEVYDDETDEPIDLTGAIIVLQFRNSERRAVATAAITIIDIGIFSAALSVNQMRGLRAETHDVGCTILINGETKQFIVGSIPVLDGIVS